MRTEEPTTWTKRPPEEPCPHGNGSMCECQLPVYDELFVVTVFFKADNLRRTLIVRVQEAHDGGMRAFIDPATGETVGSCGVWTFPEIAQPLSEYAVANCELLIDPRYHKTLKDCALDLGLSYATLYNYRKVGRLPFPEPYFEGSNFVLYDVRVIREWHQTVPPPGAPGNKRAREPRSMPAFRDEDGVEHVSQVEIGRRLGVSRQAVSNWITRKDFPKVSYEMGTANLRPWPEVEAWRERDLARAKGKS